MMSLCLRRTLLGVALAVFAVCAAGVLVPAARADGDPGSDVLVYQNLFVAADANISVPQQVELGNLLTSADKAGFPIRVAVISQPADLGAITALWRKPAAYASFLGTELSLAYAQRLLIVMPDGFGFNWQGHSASAAYRVLGGLRIGPGGTGLANAAETAVRALARASGTWLATPPSGSVADGANGGTAPGTTAQGTQSGGQPAVTSAPSGSQVPLIAGIALAARKASQQPGSRPQRAAGSPSGPASGCRSGRGCRRFPGNQRRGRRRSDGSPFPVPGSRAGSWAWRPC
jgi:hypothetical protein